MKNKRDRNSYMNYTSPHEVEIETMQCETCSFKTPAALTCKKHPVRKPMKVMRCEEKCEEYLKMS